MPMDMEGQDASTLAAKGAVAQRRSSVALDSDDKERRRAGWGALWRWRTKRNEKTHHVPKSAATAFAQLQTRIPVGGQRTKDKKRRMCAESSTREQLGGSYSDSHRRLAEELVL
ncbi:hypothetical protein DFH09DRAFT_1093460 [Mycena vulgaris]|nr:hypothetical protein DFH09DRAFT_1093460 [Mycena vulgaris]